MFELDIKSTIIAAIVSLFIGFGVGYYTKGKFVQAAVVETMVETKKETGQNITASIDRAVETEEIVRESNQQVETIRKVVAKRFKQQETKQKETVNEAALKPPAANAGACYLDVGTVGMLNAARDGSSVVGADSDFDAESQAPSDVGVAELVDNDLEIVKLYRELAINHNDLVDQVREHLNKQQGKQ